MAIFLSSYYEWFYHQNIYPTKVAGKTERREVIQKASHILPSFRLTGKYLSLSKQTIMLISWSDFEKIDMRTGTIIAVNEFPKARKPAYQLTIDFGAEIGIKRSSAQITVHYTKEELLNRQVIAVVNFPPKQIADFISECLVLGVYDENKDVILLKPSSSASNGMKVG